ncbi:hypothetical protein G4B88_006639 [Cannabis sativa]|uniref:EVE domain-containing protein n=1 Tax=Cannabis sativa TaxID=3483 RepID=A0A7J6GGQ4_CANSA|nr:hypothetical protein G4B88_006639 [Cannabis sativa]
MSPPMVTPRCGYRKIIKRHFLNNRKGIRIFGFGFIIRKKTKAENGEGETVLAFEDGAWRVVMGSPSIERWPNQVGGVKNKQAQKHLKSMKQGDLCFFYHSGAKARRVVGVVKVSREWYSEKEEEDDVVVDVEAVGDEEAG